MFGWSVRAFTYRAAREAVTVVMGDVAIVDMTVGAAIRWDRPDGTRRRPWT
jgi:hypothetical protein